MSSLGGRGLLAGEPQKAGLCGGRLTHEAGDEHPGDPLLPHLLDLGLVTGSNGGAHHRQRVDVGDRANGGSCEPGQPKEPAEASQGTNEQQVEVEAGTLEQPSRLLADDEPAGDGTEWLAGLQRAQHACTCTQGHGRGRDVQTASSPALPASAFKFPKRSSHIAPNLSQILIL